MKKLMSGLAIAVIASSAFVGAASAQRNDTANSGNGGVSSSDASGGAVTVGETGTGGTTGGAIDLSGVNTGEDLAATIIAQVLAALP
jgi:hypothetical protein